MGSLRLEGDMANVQWQISGEYCEACSCDSVCPCPTSGLAARPTKAIAAVKRAVNVGSSLSLADGLHLERSEFLASLPQP